ncbi:MAG: HEPN domain-containing protein [Deltaproteobacteria bacterium]|nr:HEPN domain-containing protein [Deltaproteobacteria bacterium]MBI3296330.1 HEPN domain-containing protein [Deltaproteobacteria bacterium]
MKNRSLAQDHIERANHRLAALEVLYERESWADVVRESQEIVELALKGLLKAHFVEVPRVHDVSEILEEEKGRLPKSIHGHVTRMGEISRDLRRDRELAFYGSEDVTPSDFYRKQDAKKARDNAKWVVETVSAAMPNEKG